MIMPLVILPPPAAGEVQGLWGAWVAAAAARLQSSNGSGSNSNILAGHFVGDTRGTAEAAGGRVVQIDGQQQFLHALQGAWEGCMAPFLMDLAYRVLHNECAS